MELRQLRYFLGVVSAGSFGKAAERLHVAQPALSRQIKSLEEELGVILLDRTARGVQVTEAGQKLMKGAAYLLKVADNIRNEVSHLGSEPAGTIIVGLPPSLAYILTPGLIRDCREKYPLVTIRVIEAFSGFLTEWLDNGKIDVAVLTVSADSRSTKKVKLCKEQMFLAGTPKNIPQSEVKIPIRELHRFSIITTSGFRSVLQPWFKLAGYEPNFEMELDSIPILRELVRKGLNCTIVPYSMVHDEVEAGELRAVPLSDPEVFRTIVLALNSQRPISLAMTAVGDLIAKQVNLIPRMA